MLPWFSLLTSTNPKIRRNPAVYLRPIAIGLLAFAPLPLILCWTHATIAQENRRPESAALLLDIEGILEPGDATLNDGSFYDEYTFEGRAGQVISITLESDVFDPILVLLDSEGNPLAENDDASADTFNSSVGIILPQDATYRVRANAYDSSGRGSYRLIAQTVDSTSEEFQRLEATRLLNEGIQQFNQGRTQQALERFQRVLTLRRAIDDRENQWLPLVWLGETYAHLGQNNQALDHYQQALTLTQDLNDRVNEGYTLTYIGNIYQNLSQYEQALTHYTRSLSIFRTVRERAGEGGVLSDIGLVHGRLGQYELALQYYEQSLAIRRAINDQAGEGQTLSHIGLVYSNLGQYEQALQYYEQSLTISREIDDREGEAVTLNNVGLVYDHLRQYERALQYYGQSLIISQSIDDQVGQGVALNNIAGIYEIQEQYQQALQFYEQSLTIRQTIGDRLGEGVTISNIGLMHENLGQYQQAIEGYQQALAVFQEIQSRAEEGTVLSNLGFLLAQQNQPQLAIVFYKQSVNVREAIRDDIRGLTQDQQQSFTNTIADDYRILANLLLQENRIFEALQVLDLLKVQELQDFFKDVNGNERTRQGLELLQEERQFWDAVNIESLQDYIQSDSTTALMEQLQQTAPEQNLTLESYADLQTRLQNLGTNSALFYPLILEDRIELVIFTRNAPPIHRPVPINSAELEAAIRTFRADLQNPYSQTIEASAQQLYDWLIKPIEADLQEANIETLIYAPDGQMRYVPLAALYDGQQWLAEKYQINYITALSLTNIESETLENPQVLAGAFSESNTEITIGTEDFSFGPIPFAENEVETLASIFPNTTKLLDTAFNREAVASERMNAHNIVHLATHGKLVSGSPEDSFILLNNGEYVTLREIQDWNLPNVALVVLSACQTALGDRLGNGIEVIGFGYQLQQAQARASIATLWEISDVGTNSLMDMFYGLLRQETMTPVEALRQAQIALITGNLEVLDDESRAATGIRRRFEQEDGGERRLGHPYYWAPFILIGNGL